MATKAIYTRINGQYYKVLQDTKHPTEVVRPHKTHAQMNSDPSCKVVNSTIWINTLEQDVVMSNKELYDKMIKELDDCDARYIGQIEDHYVMYCDYSVFNHEGKLINHNAFTRPIHPKDAMYNLGVDKTSELVYKQVKTFDASVTLNVKNEYPMGIMRSPSAIRYTLQINDIAIYQDLKHTESDIHNSTDQESYPIAVVLENMIKLYSTHDNGITISAVEVPFIPRKIGLDVHIILDNLIVAYDEKAVNDVIAGNYDDLGGDDYEDEQEGYRRIIIFNGGSALS